MFGLIIIENNVVMNSGEERSLIHYFLVKDDFRCQNIGTAMLQIIMSHKEYHDRKIMSVTLLNGTYRSIVANETAELFFKV